MKIGIPTKYRGVQFRSRLEAKWAVFFDLVGWPWLYEPIDLRGYVPDFVLQLHQPVLVEVKPALSRADMADAMIKIHRSGWERESVVVGASIGVIDGEIDDKMFPTLGMLQERSAGGNPAQIVDCGEHLSFVDSLGSWACRVCGEYDGDSILRSSCEGRVRSAWARASNHVQWRGSQGLPDVRGS